MNVTFKAGVELRGDGTLKAEARGFELTIDEPVAAGGTDKGPAPTEYLLFSLGGCLGVACGVVAEEMGIKIKNFRADLSGEINPLRFLGRPTTERAGFKVIKASVRLEADAPREKLEQLLKIVEERCPISDNLTTGTDLKIELI
jgi:uncharacterized OsmC-like protein